MNLFGPDLDQLAKEIPLSSDGKAPSGKDRVAILERELTQLRRELSTMRQMISELEKKVAAGRSENDFVEYRGALFKRDSSGGFFEEVYCPACHELMKSPQNELNFNCRNCQTWVNIKGHELPEIMIKLQRFRR